MRRAIFAGVVLAIFTVAGLGLSAEPVAVRKVDKVLTTDEEPPIWLMADYFAGWYGDSEHQPLVTTGAAPNPITLRGALGQSQTRVLLDDETDFGMHHGAAFEMGGRFGEDRRWGALAGGFLMTEKEDIFKASSDGNTVLALTYRSLWFFSPEDVERSADVAAVNFNGTGATIKVRTTTDMWGTEAAGLYRVKKCDACDIDLRFGFRQLQLSEEFNLSGYSVRNFGFVGGDFVSDQGGVRIAFRDRFEVKSAFYGAQMGAQLAMDFDRVRLKFIPRVSLGASMLDAQVSGAAIGSNAQGVVLATAGSAFYTHVNNLGDWDKTSFAVVPELDVGVEVRIVKNLSFNAGGWLKYWSNVARASEQVNRDLDRRGVAILPDFDAGAPILSPGFKFDTSDLLGYGLFAGFKAKF
jgi:hypothetical protein